MKKATMFKLSAMVLALGFVGAANAATTVTTTAVTYANEQFAGTTPSAAVVAPTINVVAGTAIPAGSTVTVMVELAGGVFGAAPTGAVNNAAGAGIVSTAALGAVDTTAMVTLGSTIVGTTAAAAGVGGAATPTANNANVVVLKMTTTAAVGIGGTLATITTPTISASGLSVAGAQVTANATVFVGTVANPLGAAVPTTGTLEAASGPIQFATSAKGITLSAAANTSTSKIDLTAATPSSRFTQVAASTVETNSTTLYKLGTLTIVDGTAKLVAAGNGAYATGAKTTTTTVTAPAGFFAAMGTTGTVTIRAANAAACAGAASATSATFATAAAAAAATSVSTPAANLTAAVAPGTTYDVCLNIAAGTVAQPTGTPALTATLGAAAAQDSVDTLVSTNLQALSLNGQTKTLTTYVPAAQAGYTSLVRVVNTGSVAAPISLSVTNEAGVTTAAATPVVASLAAGATANLSAAAIEANLATPANFTAASRPRITISAPTNGMVVQSFVVTPNGALTELSGQAAQ